MKNKHLAASNPFRCAAQTIWHALFFKLKWKENYGNEMEKSKSTSWSLVWHTFSPELKRSFKWTFSHSNAVCLIKMLAMPIFTPLPGAYLKWLANGKTGNLKSTRLKNFNSILLVFDSVFFLWYSTKEILLFSASLRFKWTNYKNGQREQGHSSAIFDRAFNECHLAKCKFCTFVQR